MPNAVAERAKAALHDPVDGDRPLKPFLNVLLGTVNDHREAMLLTEWRNVHFRSAGLHVHAETLTVVKLDLNLRELSGGVRSTRYPGK